MRREYPLPLFPMQTQPEPGLVRDMKQKEAIPEFGKQAPMKRPGQPVEVAPLYVFLASSESSYVTAETYGVTGGEHLP